jgi:uncharacterized protein (TIGR02145 family)
VETTGLTGVTAKSALVEGTITQKGGSDIISSGVCWGTNGDITIENNKTTDGGTLTGVFVSEIKGLKPEQVYYARAYATNSNGTGYGHAIPFTTVKGLTDIEGNVYNIVTIGTQVWMSENLMTTKYNDGTEIPLVTNPQEWSVRDMPAYCWYENDSSTYKIPYGPLYNWYTVNTGKLCPTGWHVPTIKEWKTLLLFLANPETSKLKEEGTSHWISPNLGATNESGFTGLPGGRRLKTGAFGLLGERGNYWSSSKSNVFDGSTAVLSAELNTYTVGSYTRGTVRRMGFSVRCIQD